MVEMDLYNEYELATGLRDGNHSAFIALYDRYAPKIYSYILRFVKIPALAEDIVQDVFMIIWSVHERIDPQRSFQAYLYRISRNQTLKALKKIATSDDLRLKVMLQFKSEVNDAENKVKWAEYQQLLHEAIARLTPQQQNVFRLCRQEGRSYKEAAQTLGITNNTVKEHLSLATRSIREYLLTHGELSFGLLLFADSI